MFIRVGVAEEVMRMAVIVQMGLFGRCRQVSERIKESKRVRVDRFPFRDEKDMLWNVVLNRYKRYGIGSMLLLG